MKSFTVKVKKRKTKKLLKCLADLGLISMRKNKKSPKVKKAIIKLGKKMAAASLDEITTEVEQVRAKRYAAKKA